MGGEVLEREMSVKKSHYWKTQTHGERSDAMNFEVRTLEGSKITIVTFLSELATGGWTPAPRT